ncbi:MAG: ABC transporter permease [Pseudobutyrivibrio sp.]|nr:ABC transporter permease [Pseudobutyrivibrio sp.]
MTKFGDYLLIQYKRIFKLLPGIVAMILVVAALLYAAGFALINSDAYKSEQQRYKLGVVGDTDDEMISLGVYMIGTLDESRYMIELVQYPDEEAAKKAMRSADISAYIVITEEFADAIDAMTNDAKLTYYATSGQKGITNIMMDEIAQIATNIIVYSETGILTLREIMKKQGYDKEIRHEKVNDLFMTYISALVLRTNVTEITELGLSDGLSTVEYYATGILLFFMLLLSFCGISYFLGTKDAQAKFMKSKGLSAFGQVLAEYIPFLTVSIIASAIIILLMQQPDKLPYLLPISIMFASLGFMIFEILIGVINTILVAFMLYIAMGYVSGYFYPKSFLPDVVQRIGSFIPSGVAFSYGGAVLKNQPISLYLLIMTAYTVCFIGLATLARSQKIK